MSNRTSSIFSETAHAEVAGTVLTVYASLSAARPTPLINYTYL